MGKVNKKRSQAGGRGAVRGGKAAPASKVTKVTGRKNSRAKSAPAGRGKAKPNANPKRGSASKPAPAFHVVALDPLRKCGARTTVEALYRVDERLEGKLARHLVFFDRHGWYCEHGATCAAVAQAKRFDRLNGSPRTRLQTGGMRA